MPCTNSGPTWALLSPNKLPSGNETKKILGAIVPDYENPAQNSIPEDASNVLPEEWFASPTTDGNFKVTLDRAKSEKAFVRLGKILDAALGKSISNNLHLTSTEVKTYAIKQEIKAFNLLKKDYGIEIANLIEQSPRRTKGCVFAVVAVKTCSEAQIASADYREKSKKVEVKVPVNETVATAGGGALPVDLDPAGGRDSTMKDDNSATLTAMGDRIFAVQYRVIKRRSQWITTPKPKPPTDFDLKDVFVPDGPSMYGDDDDENHEDLTDDDEEQAGDEDPIEIGDIKYTWSLSGCSTEDDIVLTTL